MLNIKAIEAISDIDFGAIEIGGVASVPERDEKAKQKFNHTEHTIEILEFGPKSGILQVKSNLVSFYRKHHSLKSRILVGVNLNPSTESQDYTPHLALSDYSYLARELFELSDYLVLNLSNSKSAAIKQFRKEDRLRNLLQSVVKDRDVEIGMQAATEHQQELFEIERKLENQRVERQTSMFGEYDLTLLDCYERTAPFKSITVPQIFIKIDANRPIEELKTITKVALETQVDGIIVGSCTEDSLDNGTTSAKFVGGNLKNEIAIKALNVISGVSKGKLTLVSSGGVWSGADVLERVRAGASIVQIWTSFAMNVYLLLLLLNIINSFNKS